MMTSRLFAASCLVVLLAACSGSNNSGNTNGGAGAGAGGGTVGAPVLGSGGNADGVGDPCNGQDGQTRTCCGTGTQTCGGTVEFKMWGPCLNPQGQQVTCSVPSVPGGCGQAEFGPTCVNDAGVVIPNPNAPGGCGKGEFGPNCTGTAGTPSTSGNCANGEFGPNCVPATPPGSNPPPICGPGEFGPMCAGDGGVPQLPRACTDRSINNEPNILVGYSPSMGQTVSQNGQIKVWVNDECPELVAPGEQIDMTTGAITAPGDRTAVAEDNFLLEPALYIAPQSAESGGTPHFPQYIKGFHNSVKPASFPYRCRNDPNLMATEVPGMDPFPAGAQTPEKYSTEVIWDVKALGLKPGTYIGEFMIHDGDHDRGVGCVTITITD